MIIDSHEKFADTNVMAHQPGVDSSKQVLKHQYVYPQCMAVKNNSEQR